MVFEAISGASLCSEASANRETQSPFTDECHYQRRKEVIEPREIATAGRMYSEAELEYGTERYSIVGDPGEVLS